MPIDRTNFNALVDDDGSGTKGSIWNKNAIQSVILDPTDAALAGIGAWAPVTFSATDYGNMSVSAGNMVTNAYCLVGKTLIWTVYLSGVSISAAVPNVTVVIPIGITGRQRTMAAAWLAVPGWELGTVALNNPGDRTVSVQRANYANIPATSGTLFFTLVVAF